VEIVMIVTVVRGKRVVRDGYGDDNSGRWWSWWFL
jgi:hypothetical protein